MCRLVLKLWKRVRREPAGLDDLLRAWPRISDLPDGPRAGAEDYVDALRGTVDHDRRLTHELDRQSDLLEDLSPRGVRRVFAALQQATRDPPP